MVLEPRMQGNEGVCYADIWKARRPGGRNSLCEADWCGSSRGMEESLHDVGKTPKGQPSHRGSCKPCEELGVSAL